MTTELINAFSNSQPYVQIFILFVMLVLGALPVAGFFLFFWWRQKAATPSLPDNTLLAIQQEKDRYIFTMHKHAQLNEQQAVNLLTHIPSDMSEEEVPKEGT